MSTKEYFQISIPKDITVEIPLNFDSDKPGFTRLSEEQIKDVINYNIKSINYTLTALYGHKLLLFYSH